MKAPFLNLHEWVRRLGCKYAGDPKPVVGDVVSPVAIVADHSGLVAPLRPPSAMLGFDMQTAGANLYLWRLTSMAPGGTWIKTLAWSGGSVVQVWKLYAGPLGPGSVFFPPPAPPADPYIQVVNRTALPQLLGPLPIQATLLGGESYATPALTPAEYPTVRFGANARHVFENIYLPPGWAFAAECDQSNPNQASVALVIEEVPAAAAPTA